MSIHATLDLVFERITSLAPSQLWEAWTDPKTLPKWFCPRPWKVTDCRIDLRPGGEFFTIMEGPDGERVENHGCCLEVVPGERLVWTNLLAKGYRPVVDDKMSFPFVVTLTLSQSGEAGGSKTLYRAVVAHANEEGRKKHEQMGFQEGWGIAFRQLEEMYR